jgi:signal transduction histidine kinase
LHPKLTAYLWRWEPDNFELREMPQEVFERRNESFSPDEPFCMLEQGRVEFVRIRDTDTYIPPDTERWFRACRYRDYFALPDIHRGDFKGGLSWSTKHPKGFSEDDIQFFCLTLPALTTVMRVHTNDLVLKTLTDRMEKEIEDRTAELAATNHELEQANAQISEQVSKQLEHFASMSHEIRTPLNCILGLPSLLVDSDDMSESHKDSIKMIHGSADLLAGVVNDVLDYAKLESGHFEIDIHPIDLQTTLDTVVHSISNKSKEKDVRIRTSYSGLLPRIIDTDGRRLQQVLYNLLGNATKFSRDGSNVDFSVGIKQDPTGNKLQLTVKD